MEESNIERWEMKDDKKYVSMTLRSPSLVDF